MTRVIALAVLALAACGAGADAVPGDDDVPDAGPGDAPSPSCLSGLSASASEVVAQPGTRVFVQAVFENPPFDLDPIQWAVTRDGGVVTFELAPDGRSLTFDAATAGTYEIRMRPFTFECAEAMAIVESKTPGAGETSLRLHAVVPGTERPALDTAVIVEGGATDDLNDVTLPAGTAIAGTVLGDGAPIAAYLKFVPSTAAEAPVEVFAGPSGAYSAVVRPEHHRVLVVPVSTELAPRVLDWSMGTTQLEVDAGTAISGTVTVGTTPLAGAKVQLSVGDVLSTLATTDASGQFTVRAVPVPGAQVTVEVVPPASTGLPRLLATSAFELGQPLAIQLANQTIRDLSNTVVERAGEPAAGAEVSVVGTIANAGTIAGVQATGEVRLVATTGADGKPAGLRAPARALSAVIELGPGDHAVIPLALGSGVPATIVAPAMVPAATTIRAPDGTALADVTVDVIPRGALQQAGVAPRRARSAAGGAVAVELAPGGQYDLRFVDPGSRGALHVERGVTAPLAAAYELAPATLVRVRLVGPAALPGAIVQFRCDGGPTCTGIERSRAIAEGVTALDGRVTLAVPRP